MSAYRPVLTTLPLLAVALIAAPSAAQVAPDCTVNCIPLWGEVVVTDSHYADLTVRVVDSHYPDLRVQVTDNADSCGEWEMVDSHYPDFTIRFTDSHYADIEVRFVDSYPGLP